MHSIISTVGIVITGKENYPEWSQMIKHTLIFNELWKGVCVEDRDNEPKQPTSDKELVICENKNNKAYALITTSVNEEIPHLEGGIPILDQYVESSSEEHSPLHENPTTDDALSDVINKIGRLNLDSVPTQSAEQPRPAEKGPPKWLTKTLESVQPDEVGKIGTRNSNRQNGGDVNDSNSLVDMDVSYDCEFNLSTDFEPTSFKEAASHDEWKEAMQKECDSLIKNDTWTLVDPPLGTKSIGCKWVYKNKYKADRSLYKHKARLVEKGFVQKEGVDCEETFSPTAKWATIRTLFALETQNGWKVHQMDVKTAFLNGDLKENVFMSQPEGFAVKGHEHKVCKLVKSLYGLK
eukprot:PITA_25943